MTRLFGIPVGTLSVFLVVLTIVALGVVAGLAARNRIFFKLGVRNMTRRRARSATIVAGLMLGTAIVASALATGDIMANTVRSSVITTLGNTDEIVSSRTADTSSLSTIGQATGNRYLTPTETSAIEKAARGTPLVDGVTPAIIEPVAVQDPKHGRNEGQVTLFAADPARMAGFGSIRAGGGRSVSLADLHADEVYLNADGAKDLGTRPGDRLVLFAAGRATPVTVRDVVTYDGAGTDKYAVLMPLRSAQGILGVGDRVQEVLVSNVGGALSGAAHTTAVQKVLTPAAAGFGLQSQPVKRDGLDQADKQGASFLSLFTTFGTFTIVAGILLIFLIFVMLAAERRSEMGTARAVGTQRGHLVQMFLFEGVAYDLVAAAVGSIVGLLVAIGMVRVIAGALSSTGIKIRYGVQPRSLLLAYCIGMLLTLVVVSISAWRVSRLNVVSAIRNLSEPPKPRRGARWVLGSVGVAVGGLMALNGAQSKQGGAFLAGAAILLMSTVPILRALGLPERAAFSLGGGALVVWCLLPFSAYDAIVPGMTMNFSVWVIVGILLVIGSSWVVIYNAPAILAGVTWVFGRIASLRPVLKTSIAQPLHNRFRTGTTIALFTLVVFTLVVGATTSNAFLNATNDLASYGGGFQVLAQTAPLNPITDMRAALRTAKGINPADITSYSGQSYIPVDARQASSGTFQAYPLRGLDSTFTARTTYGFSVRASGYTSDRQVWQAVATHPGYAVVDPFVVPHRANFSFAVLPKFRLHGFAVEDKTFTPVPVQIRDPQTGITRTLTVIAVLKDSAPLSMAGISTSQQTVAPFGAQARPSVWYFTVAKGVNATQEAKSLEAAFLSSGMQAKSLAKLLHDTVSASLTFQWLILGFLGLGLIIGVAALGVISARAVVERRQQIGVMRAIGFQRRMVQLSFLIESSFVTLIGILVGAGLGLLTAYNVIADSQNHPSWSNLKFAPPWMALIVILVLVFLASLATTYLPARRASRVYPAQALRYQ
jgi:putative ABC transport system permease protein